jgi:hypothetical protein
VERAFFPLDEQLELGGERLSEGVAKLVVLLGGLLPYRRVADVLERVGEMHVSASSIWRTVQVYGERMQQAEEMAADAVVVEASGGDRMGCSADGGMIHICGEGWKELKVGDIFEVELQVKVDQHSKELVEIGHAVRDTYVAHLGGPEDFGKVMWREAKRRGWETARETMMVADGALWIWNLAGTHFYDSKQVVDWYHASQHLATVAQALHGEGTPEAKHWFEKWKTPLYQGRAEEIAQMLLAEAHTHPDMAQTLQTEAGYFQTNYRRMRYMQMREDGWPIGSGMVESGCKQYKQRFTGPGMRWSRPGAQRLLPIRTGIMSNRFDVLWKKVRISPQI